MTTSNSKEIIVLSARKMSSLHKEKMQSFIEKHIGKGINIEYRLDPDILAGFIIRVGDKHIDASLRRELQDLVQNIEQ